MLANHGSQNIIKLYASFQKILATPLKFPEYIGVIRDKNNGVVAIWN